MRRALRLCALGVLGGVVLTCMPAGASDMPICITVDAGAFSRFNTPVRAELEGLKLPNGPLQLLEMRGDSRFRGHDPYAPPPRGLHRRVRSGHHHPYHGRVKRCLQVR